MSETAELAHQVASMRWYHTLELPGGIVTPGEYDLRPVVERLPWPARLAGKRCLDVGSRDGFYAFEMERRGAAHVTSVDIDDPALIDFPGPRPADSAIRAELEAGNRAFETAREALGSRVQRRHLSIYDLDPEAMGEFDLVVIGTLLLHLRDPVRALAAVRRLVRGSLILNEVVALDLGTLLGRPTAELLMEGGPFWWVVNPPGLRRIVRAAGFEVLAHGKPYLIPYGTGAPPHGLGAALAGSLHQLPRRLLRTRGAPHAWVIARPG